MAETESETRYQQSSKEAVKVFKENARDFNVRMIADAEVNKKLALIDKARADAYRSEVRFS